MVLFMPVLFLFLIDSQLQKFLYIKKTEYSKNLQESSPQS